MLQIALDAAIVLGLVGLVCGGIATMVRSLERGEGAGSGVGGMMGSINEILVFGNDRFVREAHNESTRALQADSGAPAGGQHSKLVLDDRGDPVAFQPVAR